MSPDLFVSLTTWSYAATAAAFAGLAVLLFVRRSNARQMYRLALATSMMIVWALVVVAQANAQKPFFLLLYCAEVLRDGAWIFLLSTFAARAGRVTLVRYANLAWLAALLLGPLLAFAGVGFRIDGWKVLSWTGIALSFVVIFMLEQVYRSSNQRAQDALRHLMLAVGSLFAYDLFLYSQAELMGGILPQAWSVRGIVNAIAAPLIAIAVNRTQFWSVEIFVSRHVVFYTTAFVAVGTYLFLMAVGGYYVRVFGGTWGTVAQLIFLAGAGIVLLNVLSSRALRRQLMVFISKHFFSNKYDYREEWLRFVRTLSGRQADNVHRASLRAITQIFDSPKAVLYTFNEEDHSFVASAYWPPESTEGSAPVLAEDEELVGFLAARNWIVDIAEWRRNPQAYDDIDLPDWTQGDPNWRIVSPLVQGNRLAGFVIFADSTPTLDLTYEDRDLLKTVGTHVATLLAQHDADRKLAESRQFEAYNRLTAFIMHDLKNSVAQLKLLVGNAERHRRNPEFIDDAISTIVNTVDRMTRLIEQLRGAAPTHTLRRVNLGELAAVAVERCADRQPVPVLHESPEAFEIRADRERLTSAVEHVIRNAQDATPAGGKITVRIDRHGDHGRINVVDDGCGMDSQFLRERLFRPFDSTKGSKGMGIGAYQVREYVRSLGGEVEVRSSPGFGTDFTIKLPLKSDSQDVTLPDDGARSTVAAT